MGLTTALDVAIGLVFMYLVFSLLCMSVNEAIASVLRLRARTLAEEIRRILDDDEVRSRFWSTGVMLSLARRGGSTPGEGDVAPSRAPSYLESATFARALVYALGGPEARAVLEKHTGASVLKRVLTELRAETDDDAEAFRDRVAAWFEQVMERTSGLYKRRLKLVSFLVALGIAVLVNADTVAVARTLWFDETLRAQITQSGIELAEEGGYAERMMEFGAVQEQLRPFPIGWDFQERASPTDWYASPSGVAAKLVGLLLTAFAATLGAPFWFDLLSRFVKIRSAGPVRTRGDQGGPEPRPQP